MKDGWETVYRDENNEYSLKQEADKLTQESGETWMNVEERKQFRRVCNKIGEIKSAWDS